MFDMTVAKTILSQLGGKRFIAMTGAKNFVGGNNMLAFKISSNITKNRISHVRITLTPADTYTVEYLSIRGHVTKTVHTDEDVYFDMLRATFTAATGLETSL